MPKYYVESGWVRMVLDARNPEQAAVKAFQRCRERQAEIYAEVPSGTIRDAEAVEWQLADEIRVNETGFRGTDGETFDTFEIAAVQLGYTFARALSDRGPRDTAEKPTILAIQSSPDGRRSRPGTSATIVWSQGIPVRTSRAKRTMPSLSPAAT